jgi:hypothetical protein
VTAIATVPAELLRFLNPDELRELDEQLAGMSLGISETPPNDWYSWLRTLFLRHVQAPFAKRHAEFWDWVWSIELGDAPSPFVAVWPRGGAKSSSAELAATAVGVRGRRRYAWYVRLAQEQADRSVENIAALLESESIARFYPSHAEREVGKYGHSRGWRRNRLRTAGGFTIDALGLDTAARGLKVEEQRPDLIILDDIDDKHDSAAITAKKIATITTSLLPAGASNVAVLAIQNLIIPDGFFTRLVDGRADYLAERMVSGPHPAVADLETDWTTDAKTGARRAVIVKGKATWAGQHIAACQHLMDTIGLSAFRKECQHEVTSRSEGLALRAGAAHVEKAVRSRTVSLFGGIDFGAYRFGAIFRVTDTQGVLHQAAEYFSQKGDSLETRARALDGIARFYGFPDGVPIWGDAANPTDILELNLAFERIGSKLRVLAVGMENKMRGAGVERMNDLLDRLALRYRRGVHLAMAPIIARALSTAKRPREANEFTTWQLGMNAAGTGTEMTGSRLQYELSRWSYPVPKEGQAQDQDPDDHTADGADLLAADRYAVMSWWQAAAQSYKPPPAAEDVDRARIVDRELATGRPMDQRADRLLERFDREMLAQSDHARRLESGRIQKPRRNRVRVVPL